MTPVGMRKATVSFAVERPVRAIVFSGRGAAKDTGSNRPSPTSSLLEGFSCQGFTPIPLDLLDWIVPVVSEAELRVLLYIARRTYGFGKQSDKISLSQFCAGLTSRSGVALDLGTSLSRQGVLNAIKGLRVKGLLKVVPGGGRSKVTEYEIHLSPAARARIETLKTIPREKVKNEDPLQRPRKGKSRMSQRVNATDGSLVERVHTVDPQKKELIQERVKQIGLANTTTKFPPSEQNKNENVGWWTLEELINAKKALAEHRTKYPGSDDVLPDSAITKQVLLHFSSFSEFTAWLGDLMARFPGDRIRSWGFYETDARCNWLRRRAEVEAEVAAKLEANAREAELLRLEEGRRRAESEEANLEWQRKRREQEGIVAKCLAKGWKRMKVLDCSRCAGYGRDPDNDEICFCAAGGKLERDLKKCPKCEFEGIVQRSGDPRMLDWCDCEYARVHRIHEPKRVEHHNRFVERNRLKLGDLAIPGSG